MQKFKFELASLLEFRQQEEQTAKQAYALAQQAVIQAQTATTKLLNEKHLIFAYASKSVELLQAQRRYLIDIENQMTTLALQKNEREAAVKTTQAALVQAQQARQVIEKLYVKKLAEYQAEVKRTEQIFLDEVGTQNYMRQQASGY
ncbi:hypothetical protein [Periweissella ghanensis]|uniref:Flagellar FliJ protein n=1 Tax=Periweissella ghanensis TaxID=467997 RepID=A0ABM8Z9Q6_9LACO|nr:hypothetical protein [Periweissella ghanensis]MCM0601033.1 hypothetical protein [Periweissella ghanensis]CAH0417886.1 hypothetical protein WGH24286_00302 [Periweissella ghanensis]